MAWEEIMVKYPDIVAQLPPGIIAGAWSYTAIPDPEYKRWLAPLVEKSVPHFVVTGVNNWSRIDPDFDEAFENIDTFLAAGRKSKALGLINTLWTDSQQNLLRQCWPGVAYGAIAPWQSTPVDRAQFFSEYARLVYGSTIAPDVATALEDLTQAESALHKAVEGNTTQAMWGNPFEPMVIKRAREHREDLHQARLLAEEGVEHLDRALSSGANSTSLESLVVGGRLLDYVGMKYLYAVEIADLWERQRQVTLPPKSLWEAFGPGIYAEGHSRIADLMDEITVLRPIYRISWLAEYTPYRLGKALGRWDADIGHEDSLCFNRRYLMKDVTIGWNPGKMNPNIVRPAGPVDPDVSVVYFQGAPSKPLATFVNYAMHLDTTGGTEYSADYAYTLGKLLAAAKSPEMLTIFAIGSAGNINHINVKTPERQGSIQEAARIGTILASQVLKTYPRLTQVNGPLQVRREIITVPLQEIQPGDVEKSREEVTRAIKQGENFPFLDLVRAVKILLIAQYHGKPLNAEVEVISVGRDLAWVGLPGEVFVELGMAVKHASPFRYTIVDELTNDNIHYVPDRKAFAEGNYEPTNSIVAPGGGEALVDAATRLLIESYKAFAQ